MSAYIQHLRLKQAVTMAEPSGLRSLEAQFIAWFNDLPNASQSRPFSMREIEIALNNQGRHISAILVRLGWRRKRVWSAQRYCRYWLPPTKQS
jgi:hypothetical protein